MLEELDDEMSRSPQDREGERRREVAGALGVRSIPTLVLFKDGKAVEGAIGALSKPELKGLVEPHLPGLAHDGARSTQQLSP